MRGGEAEAGNQRDDFELYDDARAVGTTLFITPGQQKLLLEAGRGVIMQNRTFLTEQVARVCRPVVAGADTAADSGR